MSSVLVTRPDFHWPLHIFGIAIVPLRAWRRWITRSASVSTLALNQTIFFISLGILHGRTRKRVTAYESGWPAGTIHFIEGNHDRTARKLFSISFHPGICFRNPTRRSRESCFAIMRCVCGHTTHRIMAKHDSLLRRVDFGQQIPG